VGSEELTHYCLWNNVRRTKAGHKRVHYMPNCACIVLLACEESVLMLSGMAQDLCITFYDLLSVEVFHVQGAVHYKVSWKCYVTRRLCAWSLLQHLRTSAKSDLDNVCNDF